MAHLPIHPSGFLVFFYALIPVIDWGTWLMLASGNLWAFRGLYAFTATAQFGAARAVGIGRRSTPLST
jgi:hypothetical protein